MAKGITIESGSPRTLNLEGVDVAQGGSANQAGLYAVGSKLYLDGGEIADADGSIGLLDADGTLTFNGSEVGGGTPTPPTPPSPSETVLWLPPVQAASSKNKYDARGFISAFDELMSGSSYPGTIKKYEYIETQDGTEDLLNGLVVSKWSHRFEEVQSGDYNSANGAGAGNYPLYHYVFTPSGGYTKTFFVEAAIHGNEKSGPQTLLRIMQIICNECNQSGYSRLAPLRDNVRFIVIPVVCPQDVNNNTQAHPYYDIVENTNKTVNPNRNGDFNHAYPLNSSGTGGNYVWQIPEIRHIKALVESVGPQNIDYLFDFHDDEGTVKKHFWFNYNMDGVNGAMSRKLLDDLIAYEEELRLAGGRDYRMFTGGDDVADELGYIHPNVADQGGYSTGTISAWAGITLGIPSSAPEYIGGIFGYGFNSEMMTRSLRIRANILIYAYETVAAKGWLVNEEEDARYFHFDYPVGMTRQGLRADSAGSYSQYERPTIAQVYARWDALVAKYPAYVVKSASLGTNAYNNDIYSYTLGSGSKKVLFIGGSMRWNVAHKETEFGIYVLAEYLCNDYIVNQSRFLQRLKQDYTIVVLPCIEFNYGDNQATLNLLGLNAAAQSSYAKWECDSQDKCVPSSFATSTAKDVPIFMSWLALHQDAIVLLSGGEDTSVYSGERPKYETDYMTQVIYTRNQPIPSWLTAYCNHLEDRGENAPDVEPTKWVEYYSRKLGLTCGDYAYDTYGIPAYFINLKVSDKWAERRQYAQANDSAEHYMYRNYETGRRIANIVNFFLMAGGDIADGGGLVNNNE